MATALKPVSASNSLFKLEIPVRQAVGETLNYAAAWLKRPLNYASNEVIRCIFTRVDPEVVGNAPSKYLEIAKRGGMLLLCIVTSTVTLPLFGIGVGIDILGDRLTNKAYTRLEGSPEPYSPSSYRIYSQNVNMLPYDRIFGGTRPAEERIAELAHLINIENVDIVALQELSFANAVKLWNKSGMRTHFRCAFTRIGPSPTTDFDTCLFIASKVPIIGEPVFIPFRSSNAFKRGLLYVKTDNCIVMTTHLESDDKTVRQEQFSQTVSIIKALEESMGKPVVLLMDGNIDRNTDEYSSMQQLRDHYTGLDSTCYNGLNQYMKGGEKPDILHESIDYVCTSLDSKAKIENLKLVKAFDRYRPGEAISDHHGFRATVTFPD